MQSTTKRQKDSHPSTKTQTTQTSSSSSSSGAMDQFLHLLKREMSEHRTTPISAIVIESDNAIMMPDSSSQSFSRLDTSELDESFKEERWESPEHILRNDGTPLAQPVVISKQKHLPPVPRRQESIELSEAIICLK